MSELSPVEAALGLSFFDKTLLRRALTHRSYLNENPDYPLEDNERLEFLGDAVLDFITGEYLYHHFPEMPEGRLTNLRSALVRTESLADFAGSLNLGDHLFLGRGEDDSGGRRRPAILCDAYEALIGALYLDQGIDKTRDFALAHLKPALEKVLATDSEKDPKSQLQEITQSEYQLTPTYRTVKEEGPDHAKEFTIEAVIGNRAYGTGKGFSKQNAAQAAAQAALDNLLKELTERNG